MVHIMLDEVVTVLGKTQLNAVQICGIVLANECTDTEGTTFGLWNVSFPKKSKPPVKPIPPPRPETPTLRILHLSDVHYDAYYREGSNADCGEPLCCRRNDGKPGTVGAGKWGDSRGCDTPLRTLQHLFKHLSSKDKFDYILWTGDLPPHDVWNQTRESQLSVIQSVTEMILQYFPKTPVFPALGNHEGVPVNSFPPEFVKGNQSMTWLYEVLAKTWKHWLPGKDTFKTVSFGAYYSTQAKPGLRVIALNTNFCNNFNWWLVLNFTDPNGDLQWLIKELQKAENSNEKVQIIGHIPPGIPDCLKEWSWNYYKIINRYESTVVGQFFGHTHKDSYEVFYDLHNMSRPINVAYVAPSVTPFAYLNPGYRVYTVDGVYKDSSYVVLDHETYIMNLTDTNLYDRPRWNLEYTAKAAYGLKSLLPAAWDGLLQRMTHNSTLFNQYYRYYFKSLPQKHTCDAACRDAMLCELRSARSHDPELCKHLHTAFSDIQKYHHRMRAC